MIVLLFAFYALFVIMEVYSHQILIRSTFWVSIRTRIKVKLLDGKNFYRSVSFQIYHSTVLIVNIWMMEIWLLLAQFHYHFHLSSLSQTPPPQRLMFIPSLRLRQQYCTVQHSSVIYRRGFKDQTFSRWSESLLTTHTPPPNLTHTFYFSTLPVYTCTVLLCVSSG